MAKHNTSHKKGARGWAFPLGLCIAIFSIIGLVTVLVAGVNGIQKSIQKSKNFDEYNQLLVPVVMNDPDAFDDITKAKPAQLIDISIWSILKGGLSPDKYEYSDTGILLPEADVEAAFQKLFGTDIAPVHSSVEGYGYDFAYDANKKIYIIPLTGVVPLYTPQVVSVEKKNNARVLTVGYLASDQWQQDEYGNMLKPTPDKYMRVTLRKTDDAYHITALQNTSAPEIASTKETKPETTAAPTEPSTAAPVPETTLAETEATESPSNDTTAA